MVATPEEFKILAKKLQKKRIDEAAAKEMIGEYEREFGLERVPAKALRGVIKTCKGKGAHFLADPALEPTFVLLQWMGLPTNSPSQKSKSDSESSGEPEPKEDEPETEPDESQKPEKPKRKQKRSKNDEPKAKAPRHKKAKTNVLPSLHAALGKEDSGSSDSSDSTFTKERKRRNKRPIVLSSDSSSSESESSQSSKSVGSPDPHARVSLRAVAKRHRAMRLLCEKREAKNLFRGFVARAMNTSAYTATLTFGSIRNRREAETLARAIDFFVDQFGAEAVGKVDAMEVLLRRYTAVLHAENSTWEFATCFEESPEGPFVEAKIFNRVKKMAKLQGIPVQAMRPAGQAQGGREDGPKRLKATGKKSFPNRKMEGSRVIAANRPPKDE